MRITPKMFICEVPERVMESGECCWIHGSVVDLEFAGDGELDAIVLDDGTSSIRVSIGDRLRGVASEGFQEEQVRLYKGLIEKLLQRGRHISAVCQLREGVLRVLHISDSASQDKDPENGWLDSIARLRG
ncbi:hypothetical protein OJ252_1211 [Cryptosporidium canis]|uniref:Uncharacterized protein n=1 Tax=Cryptosporidium canis TaxID=195482 RepID=A0ABQ8P8Q5_9CRYT|nr:hypothetical protein OJ252_1211 [Cryptosporidium canis]